MIWWTLALWALGKLIDWLLLKQYRRERLTTAEREHVEKIIYQTNRVRSTGTALGCAISVAGITRKEAAGHMAMPESQLADWIAGRGYIQTHRVMGVECLRIPFIRALALWAGLTVRTSIDFDERRTA